jgi:hypothetical protein
MHLPYQTLDSANCPISGELLTPLAIEFTTIPLDHMLCLYAVILIRFRSYPVTDKLGLTLREDLCYSRRDPLIQM